MTPINKTDLSEQPESSYYNSPYAQYNSPYAQYTTTTSTVPNIQKMMYAILELQQKLTEVASQCDMLLYENNILKGKVEILDSMRN